MTLVRIMESYKIDRTYTWVMSAIGHSKDIEKRYYYDPERKLFFNIGCTNGIYHLCTYQPPISVFDSQFILSQIDLLREKASNLIEVPKSNRKYHLFKIEAKETEEEFQNRENDWKRLFEEAEVFLRRNNIKISETRLIE